MEIHLYSSSPDIEPVTLSLPYLTHYLNSPFICYDNEEFANKLSCIILSNEMQFDEKLGNMILKYNNQQLMVLYAISTKKRWYECEKFLTNCHDIISYCKNFGRIKELEQYILLDPYSILIYAREVVKARFIEGETTIKHYPTLATQYARNIIQGRWHEAEYYIIESGDEGAMATYALSMIKGRWYDIEHLLSPYGLYFYIRMIGIQSFSFEELEHLKNIIKEDHVAWKGFESYLSA